MGQQTVLNGSSASRNNETLSPAHLQIWLVAFCCTFERQCVQTCRLRRSNVNPETFRMSCDDDAYDGFWRMRHVL